MPPPLQSSDHSLHSWSVSAFTATQIAERTACYGQRKAKWLMLHHAPAISGTATGPEPATPAETVTINIQSCCRLLRSRWLSNTLKATQNIVLLFHGCCIVPDPPVSTRGWLVRAGHDQVGHANQPGQPATEPCLALWTSPWLFCFKTWFK